MKLPDHLGITALEKYAECPRCFWLSYIAGFRDAPSPAQELGTEVHKAIATYHKEEPPLIISSEAQGMLDAYKEVVGPEVVELAEFQFETPFDNIATGETLPFRLKGFVDGVDTKTDWLFENKTASNYWNQEDVDTNIQATAYAYGYYMFFGKLPAGIRFQIIKKNKKPKIQLLETYRTFEDLVYLWEWAKGLVDRMNLDDFAPRQTRFGFHHRLCPYCKVGDRT